MKASEWIIISLLSLALATRIAGSKYFEGFHDVRIKVMGIRFRIISAALLFAASMIAVFTSDIPTLSRIIGGLGLPIGAGMMYWECATVIALSAELSTKEEKRR